MSFLHNKIVRHILYFVIGASLVTTLMLGLEWDQANSVTHWKLFLYAIMMSGLFAAASLQENEKHLEKRCKELETENADAWAQVRSARRVLFTDVQSLDRRVLDQWLAGRLKQGFANEDFYMKADREVLLAYIDLLCKQVRKHVPAQTEEQIIEEQLEFRRQHPIKE